jgi:hypothetical protein
MEGRAGRAVELSGCLLSEWRCDPAAAAANRGAAIRHVGGTSVGPTWDRVSCTNNSVDM